MKSVRVESTNLSLLPIIRLIVVSMFLSDKVVALAEGTKQAAKPSNLKKTHLSSLEANFWPPTEGEEQSADIDEYDSADNYDDHDTTTIATSEIDRSESSNRSSLLHINETENGKLQLIRGLSNVSREVGQTVKLRCEISGKPSPEHISWYKNDAPVQINKHNRDNHIRIRQKIRSTPSSRTIESSLKITHLEIHDKGYYRCFANNGIHSLESTGILFVKTQLSKPNDEDIYNVPELSSSFSDFSNIFQM